MSPLCLRKWLPYFKETAHVMKVDSSNERKGQRHAFYQNEHNLASQSEYFVWNFHTVYSFLSPSSLSQREKDHFVVEWIGRSSKLSEHYHLLSFVVMVN